MEFGIMSTIKNQYYKDSFEFFKRVSKNIAKNKLLSDFEVTQNVLFFAIGVEKLLKGILYNINPLYILKNSDFKNSAGVCYKSLVKNDGDLNKKPESDVIAFHSCIMFSSVFSQSVMDNKNTLMKLKDARDIIIHCTLKELVIEELKTLLERDFYPLLDAVDQELHLGGQLNFFNNNQSILAFKSSELQINIVNRIELRKKAAESRWKQIRGTKFYTGIETQEITDFLLSGKNVFPTDCPVCGNEALFYANPIREYNPSLRKEVQVGLIPKKLDCKFCLFEVSDYKEFDYLKIDPKASKPLHYVKYIAYMPEEEAKEELEDHLSNRIWEITESGEFAGVMAETNACGFVIDEYSVESYETDDGKVKVSISYYSSGDQIDDKTWCGDKISGTAEVSIADDGSIAFDEITASVDH
jgi:hypothetical protein